MATWGDPTTGDPRATHAPEVLAALQASCASVRAASDPALLELARLRLVDLLGDRGRGRRAPAWGEPAGGGGRRAGVVADLRRLRRPRPGRHGPHRAVRHRRHRRAHRPARPRGRRTSRPGVLPFVQGLYLLDVGQRAAIALGALFASPVPSSLWAWPAAGADVPADPMAAVDQLMRATGRLRSLDPVLRELVRLRGARHHQCRRCQSVRSVAALEAGRGGGPARRGRPHRRSPTCRRPPGPRLRAHRRHAGRAPRRCPTTSWPTCGPRSRRPRRWSWSATWCATRPTRSRWPSGPTPPSSTRASSTR